MGLTANTMNPIFSLRKANKQAAKIGYKITAISNTKIIKTIEIKETKETKVTLIVRCKKFHKSTVMWNPNLFINEGPCQVCAQAMNEVRELKRSNEIVSSDDRGVKAICYKGGIIPPVDFPSPMMAIPWTCKINNHTFWCSPIVLRARVNSPYIVSACPFCTLILHKKRYQVTIYEDIPPTLDWTTKLMYECERCSCHFAGSLEDARHCPS